MMNTIAQARRARRAACVVLALILAVPLVAHAERTFGQMVGLGVKFSQGQPASELPLLKELGVKWVREQSSWGLIEPSPGQYKEFPVALQERLAYYRENDIGVCFILLSANSTAYPATPDNPARPVDAVAFGRYAAHVARLLKASGVRFVLEVWNEPHNSFISKTIGGSWNGKPPAPWLQHYVRMVREAVREVKAFDRTVKVLSDDDMWILHYWFLEAGLPAELDGFAFHPYTGGIPEKTAVASTTEWLKPFAVVDADQSFRSAVRRLREHGRSKLGHTPEMWVTEWGWPIGDDRAKGQVSEDLLARYIPRAFVNAAAAGVEVMLWFSSKDSVDGPMGLVTNNGQRRLSYHAFKTMTRQLGDYVFVKQLANTSAVSGLQAYLFRAAGRADDFKLVLWNLDASPRFVAATASFEGASGVDVMGQPVARTTGPGGRRGYPITDSPLYLGGIATTRNIEELLQDDDRR